MLPQEDVVRLEDGIMTQEIYCYTNYYGMIRTSFFGVVRKTAKTAVIIELRREYVGETDKNGWYNVKAGNKPAYDAKEIRASIREDGALRFKQGGMMQTARLWNGQPEQNH